MSRVRMNNEYRNKLLNLIKPKWESADTVEKNNFFMAREQATQNQNYAFEIAKQVVERSYPKDDVNTCNDLKKKYGQPLDVVAKDKCFYFAHNEDTDEEGENTETKSHFDFGLYGNLNGTESHYNSENSHKHFAYAMYREEMIKEGLNPDIIAEQKDNHDNPHQTKHIDKNDKYLGYSGYSRYNSDDDNTIGIAKGHDSQFYCDIIGVSHCRSRAIPCTKDEYATFMMWRIAKGQVVSTHQKYIEMLVKKTNLLKSAMKHWKYLDDGITFANKLGIEVKEEEIIRANSSGLAIYDPNILADMILDMDKNTNQTREEKIKARLLYEENQKQAIN